MKICCDNSQQAFGANSTMAAKEIFADGIRHMIKKNKTSENFNKANMLLEDLYQHAPEIKIGGKYVDKNGGIAYIKMPIGNQDNLTKVNTHDSNSFLSVLKKLSYLIHNHIENNKLNVFKGNLPDNSKPLSELEPEQIVNRIMKKTVRMD